jgi:hypothetical protein
MMLDQKHFNILNGYPSHPEGGDRSSLQTLQAISVAQDLHRQAYSRGQIFRIWCRMTGRQSALYDLATTRKRYGVLGHHALGVRTINLHQIQGSEGRVQDFDLRFYPRNKAGRDRWENIARLRWLGKALEPIDVIQVGSIYFVRDGHHRVSVARALGQRLIDAYVLNLETERVPLEHASPAGFTLLKMAAR